MAAASSSEEQALREAAERLLNGRPTRVTTTRLSVGELVEESGVDRNRVYRHYEDLKDDFLARARQLTEAPPPATPRERELQSEVNALQEQLDAARERSEELGQDKKRWKEAAEAAFRIINLLEVERDRAGSLSDSRDLTIKRLENDIADLRNRQHDSLGDTAPRASVTMLPGTQKHRAEPDGDPSSSTHDDR
mgnify:FL=1